MKKENKVEKLDGLVMHVTVAVLLFMAGVAFAFHYLSAQKVFGDVIENNDYDYSWLETKSLQMYNQSIYNLSTQNLSMVMIYNYKYSSYYDCKYWASFYHRWFKINGYAPQYVLLDTHVFTVAEKNNSYWIADGMTLLRIDLKGD